MNPIDFVEENVSPLPARDNFGTIAIFVIGFALCFFIGRTALSESHHYYEQEKYYTKASVTMYSAQDSCHYKGCPMASGKRAQVGYVACNRAIPFGTQIEIEGIVYTCSDRLSKWVEEKYGLVIDIFAGHSKEAYKIAKKFGRQDIKIAIYND